ncbi:predicted protein, partial [Naegleria gruberi]
MSRVPQEETLVNTSRKATNFLFLTDYLIGGASRAIGRTLTAPIDRFMILLHHPEKPKFPQACFLFWRGNLLNMIKSFFPNTVVFNFAIKDLIKRQNYLPFQTVDQRGYGFVVNQFVSGGLAGACCEFVRFPFDNIMKFRVGQLGSGMEKYFGLFKGAGISVMSAMVYRSLYFGLNDSLREVNTYRNDLGVKGVISKYGIAQLASASAWIMNSPISTIQRRMIMQQQYSPNQWHYNSSID